ncbi:hypothetical protein AKJ51_01435 [candidate division MSBL1 archaeon SCGC-AAA382A20]|uniref:N-acetyltransferase domain-containing protein n=1 Tax=candidate division MSBL1 archaeon SCGC-AAA382A20 TaxID=1698280 RepID=A0A133VLU2_9EURY|nr:hypothetical protein AKJ51_01435 [candidate division MSBL1 archaeon SCGC-AAA382A20]
MKGWFKDRYRHGLSALGIRTKLDSKGMSIYPTEYGDDIVVYSMEDDGIEMRTECNFEKGYCHLYHLYVPKEKRGKGIGTAIIQEMEDIANSEGLEMMFISIGESDRNLESFMEELGYERGHLDYNLEKVSQGETIVGKYYKPLKGNRIELELVCANEDRQREEAFDKLQKYKILKEEHPDRVVVKEPESGYYDYLYKEVGIYVEPHKLDSWIEYLSHNSVEVDIIHD